MGIRDGNEVGITPEFKSVVTTDPCQIVEPLKPTLSAAHGCEEFTADECGTEDIVRNSIAILGCETGPAAAIAKPRVIDQIRSDIRYEVSRKGGILEFSDTGARKVILAQR